MKTLLIVCSVLWFGTAFGQGVFDPDCYVPQLGDGLDTIYGSRNEQALGDDLRNIGPKLPGGRDQLLMRGLPPQIPFLSVVEDGAGFDLRSLRQSSPKQKFPIELGAYDYVKFGHFRDTKHRDMLVGELYPVIYWADENGDYDSSRSTALGCSVRGDVGGGLASLLRPVYVAHLTSDSVLDVIGTHLVNWLSTSGRPDSFLYVLWRGGHHLYDQGQNAYEDSVLFIDTLGGADINRLSTYQGDYRGVGREDLICVDDSNNWLYYKNDPPFSMQKFYDGIRFDTLLSAYENRPYGYYVQRNNSRTLHSRRVMAKPEWDRSEDIITQMRTSVEETTDGIFFFQGGADFGSKRLTLPTVTDIIYHPSRYSQDSRHWYWGLSREGFAGDMTGTGNEVLYCESWSGGYFYVLGRAFDDKADIYYEHIPDHIRGTAVGGSVAFDADGDSYGDIIVTNSNDVSDKDWEKEWEEVGSIYVVKGSPKIPVRLNPKYAVGSTDIQRSKIHVYPNPCGEKTVLMFENCSVGVLELVVIDNLGRKMFREEVIDVDGLQQYALDMSAYPAGVYHVRLSCPSDGWSSSVNIIKE